MLKGILKLPGSANKSRKKSPKPRVPLVSVEVSSPETADPVQISDGIACEASPSTTQELIASAASSEKPVGDSKTPSRGPKPPVPPKPASLQLPQTANAQKSSPQSTRKMRPLDNSVEKSTSKSKDCGLSSEGESRRNRTWSRLSTPKSRESGKSPESSGKKSAETTDTISQRSSLRVRDSLGKFSDSTRKSPVPQVGVKKGTEPDYQGKRKNRSHSWNYENPTKVYIQHLKRNYEEASAELRELRIERDELIHRAHREGGLELQRKLELQRRKAQEEKERALAANTSHLRQFYEEKLEQSIRIKDKELRCVQNQLKKQQEKPSPSTTYVRLSAPITASASLSVKTTQTQIVETASVGSDPLQDSRTEELNALRLQVIFLQEKLAGAVGRERHRDQELRQLRGRYESDVSSCSTRAQLHVGKLLEELREKERRLARLGECLAALGYGEEGADRDQTAAQGASGGFGGSSESLRLPTTFRSPSPRHSVLLKRDGTLEEGENKGVPAKKDLGLWTLFGEPKDSVRKEETKRGGSSEEEEGEGLPDDSPEEEQSVRGIPEGEDAETGEEMPGFFGHGRNTGKAFGSGSQVMGKEEHEKEKQRWAQKLAEVEVQLQRAEALNAELHQNRAELNKKIADHEKNQRPLIENNKRLADKNRYLLAESRKMEEKVRHAQEDYLILKDHQERLLVDYSKVKETRATPEKLEDLEKFKQQNLEYCKCITSLKASAIEKDRRIALLQQKLHRLRRSKGPYDGVNSGEEDGKSFIGSECSLSSMSSLDTITEDFEELPKDDLEQNYRSLAKEHMELQRAFTSLKNNVAATGGAEQEAGRQREQLLQRQLNQSQTRLNELERTLSASSALGADSEWAQEKLAYKSKSRMLEKKVEDLEEGRDKLIRELEELKEQNELLEFQVLELEQAPCDVTKDSGVDSPAKPEVTERKNQSEQASGINRVKCDQAVSTSDDEGLFSMYSDLEGSGDELSGKEIPREELKIRMTLLKHRPELRPDDKAVVVCVRDWLDALTLEHSQCELRQMELELRYRENDAALRSEIAALKDQLDDPEIQVSPAKEAEELRKTIQVAEENLKTGQAQIAEMEKNIKKLEFENQELIEKLATEEGKKSSLQQTRLEELENLGVQMKAKQREVEEKEKEIYELNEQLCEKEKEQLELLSDLSVARIDVEKTKIEIENYKKVLAQKVEEISNLEKKLELENQTSSETLKSLQSTSRSQFERLKEIESLLSHREEQLQETKKEIVELQARNQALDVSEENEALKTEIQALKTSLSELGVLVEEQRTKTSKVEELETVKKNLEERLEIEQRGKSELAQALKVITEQADIDKQQLMDAKKRESQQRDWFKEEEKAKLEMKIQELETSLAQQTSQLTEVKKQLAKSRAFQDQLETQFQMQLQVDALLKQQLRQAQAEVQKLGGGTGRAVYETGSLDRSKSSSSAIKARDLRRAAPGIAFAKRSSSVGETDVETREKAVKLVESTLLDLKLGEMKVEQLEEKARLIERGLSDLSLDGDLSSETRKFCSNLANLFKQTARVIIGKSAMEKEVGELKKAVSEGRERAERLGRQYHETVVMLGQLQKKQIRREQCIQTEEENSSPGTNPSLSRLLFELRRAHSLSTCQDEEGEEPRAGPLRQYRSGNDVHRYSNRPLLPISLSTSQQEFHEGGVCEESPLGISEERSSSSASAPSSDAAPTSPPLRSPHSSLSSGGEDSSLSDSPPPSWTAEAGEIRGKSLPPHLGHSQPIAPRSKRSRVGAGKRSISVSSSPSSVRLTESLNKGTYFLLEWIGPNSLSGVTGYKVYIGGKVYKTLTDATSTKLLIERQALLPSEVHSNHSELIGDIQVSSVLWNEAESPASKLSITSARLQELEEAFVAKKSMLTVQLAQ